MQIKATLRNVLSSVYAVQRDGSALAGEMTPAELMVYRVGKAGCMTELLAVFSIPNDLAAVQLFRDKALSWSPF
jgi:hypothetical protein